MKGITLLVLIVALVIGGGGGEAEAADPGGPPGYRAVVVEVGQLQPVDSLYGPGAGKQQVKIRLTSGPDAGEEVWLMHHITGNPAFDIEVSAGDRVMVGIYDDGPVRDVFIMDFVRDVPLAWMAGIFALSLFVVGGTRGAKMLVTLVITALAVYYLLIPMVLAGRNPVLSTVLIGSGVVMVTMVLVAGLNRKALAAGVGTVAGVVVAGILAWFFGSRAHLMGLHSQEAQMLYHTTEFTVDFRGLLFAGMILGALGAVMDVAVSIASAVAEVREANPELSVWDLASSGLNVGRDVLGTMANTLILAYAGGALPLLLLLTAHGQQMAKVLNLDIIATEVVRALSGSTGLAFTVPATALLAALLQGRLERTPS